MSRVDEIRALIAANGYGDGGISIGAARDLLALYDEAHADGLPATTWRAMWNGLRGKLDALRSELAAATERAERAEALAADRGEAFTRMHTDRDAWKARAEKAEAEAAKLHGMLHCEMLAGAKAAYCATCELTYASQDADTLHGWKTCPGCAAEKAEAERDARPDITPEDAARFLIVTEGGVLPSIADLEGAHAVRVALRAHAAKATNEGSVR